MLSAAAACSSINNHLLEGQQYSAGGACLAAPAVIDDLPGDDPGDNCAPECLVVPARGGGAVFITTTCPPYAGYPPPEMRGAARDAADPCVGAFAAYDSDAGPCASLDGALPEASADAAAPTDAAHADATLDARAGDAGTGATTD